MLILIQVDLEPAANTTTPSVTSLRSSQNFGFPRTRRRVRTEAESGNVQTPCGYGVTLPESSQIRRSLSPRWVFEQSVEKAGVTQRFDFDLIYRDANESAMLSIVVDDGHLPHAVGDGCAAR